MIILLTTFMAATTTIQCLLVALTTHWHHQDRKQMAFEQKEIEALQKRESDDEAEIRNIKNAAKRTNN